MYPQDSQESSRSRCPGACGVVGVLLIPLPRAFLSLGGIDYQVGDNSTLGQHSTSAQQTTHTHTHLYCNQTYICSAVLCVCMRTHVCACLVVVMGMLTDNDHTVSTQ
eukprot:scpid86092/ scgid16063/ 